MKIQTVSEFASPPFPSIQYEVKFENRNFSILLFKKFGCLQRLRRLRFFPHIQHFHNKILRWNSPPKKIHILGSRYGGFLLSVMSFSSFSEMVRVWKKRSAEWLQIWMGPCLFSTLNRLWEELSAILSTALQ